MELTDTIVEQRADEPAVVSSRTLPALLAARVARNAEGPLFSDGTTVWSGADAIEIAARRAGTLAAHGIKRGDRVALLCGNRAEFMEVVLGCGWLGAVVVPINTASRGPQLEHILRNSGARLLVAEAHLVDVVHALDARDLPLEHIWLIDEPVANSLAPRYSTTPLPPGSRVGSGRERPRRRCFCRALYLRYVGVVQRGDLSACPVLLVGIQHGA